MPSSSISCSRGSGSRKAGKGADRLAHDLAPGLAFRVAALEVLLLGAGRGHHLEGRVRDVVADTWPLTAIFVRPLHLDVLDQPLVLGRQELRERVGGLVHVVVGVEHREIEDS